MTYQALWRGTVLAESDDIVELEGTVYFPPRSLRVTYFQTSATTAVCPWKGIAYYFTITVAGHCHFDAAWTYLFPQSAAERIRDHVAFSPGIEIRHAHPVMGVPMPQGIRHRDTVP
jgi:uncharacterized protein (DUF427 family)